MISNNIFEYDTTDACGGGVYAASDSPVNTDYEGPIICNNIFRNNFASIGGGGVSFGHSGKGRVINNTFIDNWGGQGG